VSEVPLGGGGEEDPRTARLALGADLSLPGVTFLQQQLLVVSDAAPYANYPARGIIGKTIFNCVVEIDYDKGLLHLYDSAAYKYDGSGESFDVGFSHGIPVIDSSVSIRGGQSLPVKLLVDTGAAQLLLFTFSHEDIQEPRGIMVGLDRVLSKGFTGTVRGSTGRVARLRLGKQTLEGVITSFPDEESWGTAKALGQNGMIGNEVLKRFRVVFDYPHQRIHLEPGLHFGAPFDWDMAGVLTERTPEGTLEVIDVVLGSPATENEILPGDVVVAIDDRPVAGMTDNEIWDAFTRDGERLNLTIDRNSRKLQKRLVLRRMI